MKSRPKTPEPLALFKLATITNLVRAYADGRRPMPPATARCLAEHLDSVGRALVLARQRRSCPRCLVPTKAARPSAGKP
jgi:hypothetical protein